MNARISQLHKTEAEWQTVQAKYEARDEQFIPRAGELIVYDPDSAHEYARLKVGDGKTAIQYLPFITDTVFMNLSDSTRTIDAGRI